jgi:hypothetical protein
MTSQDKKRFDLCERIKARLRASRSPNTRNGQAWNFEEDESMESSNPSEADQSPLHQIAPYFEVRPSTKGGYGAFALEYIPPFTMILSESSLMEGTNGEILEKFEALSQDDKEAFLKLASFDEVDSNKVIAIFKTNR